MYLSKARILRLAATTCVAAHQGFFRTTIVSGIESFCCVLSIETVSLYVSSNVLLPMRPI